MVNKLVPLAATEQMIARGVAAAASSIDYGDDERAMARAWRAMVEAAPSKAREPEYQAGWNDCLGRTANIVRWAARLEGQDRADWVVRLVVVLAASHFGGSAWNEPKPKRKPRRPEKRLAKRAPIERTGGGEG